MPQWVEWSIIALAVFAASVYLGRFVWRQIKRPCASCGSDKSQVAAQANQNRPVELTVEHRSIP